MLRVHGLLTPFLKYNKLLKLYNGNSPSDFLGTRHYATRRGCRVWILKAWKCIGCDTICCTLTKLYLTLSVNLQMLCSRLLTLCIQLELEAIRGNYTFLIVLLM